MDNENLLFYNEYEQFYKMAQSSDSFRNFCKDAFGEDFSQDGFSDIRQINRIFDYIPQKDDVHILLVKNGKKMRLLLIRKKVSNWTYRFSFFANLQDHKELSDKTLWKKEVCFMVGIQTGKLLHKRFHIWIGL